MMFLIHSQGLWSVKRRIFIIYQTTYIHYIVYPIKKLIRWSIHICFCSNLSNEVYILEFV